MIIFARFSHSKFREFSYDYGSEPSVGFIDGDVIELFLDMTVKDREEVLKGLTFDPNSIFQTSAESAGESSAHQNLDDDVIMADVGSSSVKKSTGNQNAGRICVDDVVKLVEDLARLH